MKEVKSMSTQNRAEFFNAIGWRINRIALGVIRLLPLGKVTIFHKYTSLIESKFYYRLGRTFFGSKIWCDPVDTIQNRILYFGIWEPDLSILVSSSLQEGDVFVDIGANIGYDSLLAASRVGPSGRVVSIEASPMIFKKLEANIERNGVSNIRLINAAMSSKRGVVNIVDGPAENVGSTFISDVPSTGCTQVHSYPVTEVLTDDELRRTRMIKMDIEGSEIPVMQDILRNIDRFGKKLEIITEITLLQRRQEWEQLFSAFASKGFRAYKIKNDYHPRHYLEWLGTPDVQLITELPNVEMLDVLFSRSRMPRPNRG